MRNQKHSHGSALENTDRLEAFSDGVMAVIITLMAFSVKAPAAPTWSALHHTGPSRLVYVLSFSMVGIYWNNHHHLLRTTERISAPVMWCTLILLFWLSLLPFATSWIGRFPNHVASVVTYGLVSLGAGISFSFLVHAIVRANGVDSDVGRAVQGDLKGFTSIGLYAVGSLLGFVSALGAFICFGLVAVMWVIPDRRFVRRHAH